MGWEFKGCGDRHAVASGNVVLQLPYPTFNDFASTAFIPSPVSLFVASGGSNGYVTSPDGATWTSRSGPWGSDDLRGLTWVPDLGLLFGVGPSGGIYSTSDGINWTTHSSGVSDDLWDIAYSSSLGLLVAVGDAGTILTSPTGGTWTSRTSGTSASLLTVAFGAGVFVCASFGAAFRSADGLSWAATTTVVDAALSISYYPGDGIFLASGGTGYQATSTDGDVWTSTQTGTTDMYASAYSPALDLYVSVGAGGVVYSSPDAVTWTARTTPTTNTLRGAVWEPVLGKFIAVGLNGTTLVSTDAVTWAVVPRALVNGDLLVACIASRSNVAYTRPAGWNLVATEQLSGNTSTTPSTSIASGMMAYFVYSGTPPGLTFTRAGANSAIGALVVYGGGHTTAPYNTGVATTMASNSTTVSSAGATAAEEDSLVVAMVAGADNTALSAIKAATDPSASSGLSVVASTPTYSAFWNRHISNTSLGADTALAIADGIKQLSGATGNITATQLASCRSVLIAGIFKPNWVAPTLTAEATSLRSTSVSPAVTQS